MLKVLQLKTRRFGNVYCGLNCGTVVDIVVREIVSIYIIVKAGERDHGESREQPAKKSGPRAEHLGLVL